VAAAGGNPNLVELRMEKEPPQSVLATGRVSVDSHSRDVIIGILSGHGLVPQNPVWKASIAQVLPADIMEGLGPVTGTHAVYLYDDESHLGQCLHAIAGAERLGHE